jgi:hypothetical protein
LAHPQGPRFAPARPALRCYACFEPTGADRTLDADGRVFCSACAPQRISSRAELLALWSRARRFLRGIVPNVPRAALRELGPGELSLASGIPWLGTPERKLGQTLISPAGIEVSIEGGLPRDLTAEVLAHELGHAWYARHGLARAPETTIEGFPQWVAYGFCRYLGYRHQLKRILARPGPMGRGARALVALEAKSGVAAVIRAARGLDHAG